VRSKQTNFYATPGELPAFENYFKECDAVFITLPFASNIDFVRTSMSTRTSNKEWEKIYLTKTAFLPQVKTKFIEEQGYYLIDETRSAVMQFSRPLPNLFTGNIERSRFYYVNSYWGEVDEIITKDEAFSKWCDSVRRGFAKRFLIKAVDVADDKCTKGVLQLLQEGKIQEGTPLHGRYKIVDNFYQ
jgi:hypothetical protein